MDAAVLCVLVVTFCKSSEEIRKQFGYLLTGYYRVLSGFIDESLGPRITGK